MLGYQRFEYSPIISRPPLKWPNNERVALWIIVNVEHFLFDRPATSIYKPLPNYPDVLNYGWRDYGVRIGIWRLMNLFDRLRVRASVTLNSNVCTYYPQIIEECLKRDWEFLGHGKTNSQLLSGMSQDEERSVIRQTISTIRDATGKTPEGWLGPALAETYNTPDILAEEGIKYVCDWCNDDQPYFMNVQNGSLLSLPYSIELNDIPAFLGFGHTPEIFKTMICDQFDTLYKEGKESGRVMAIALHPFIIGQPFRIKYLAEAIEYIINHPDVWIATGSEIADAFSNQL